MTKVIQIRGNQLDSVWWKQDFKKIEFNGTRATVRGKRPRKGLANHEPLGVRVPPIKVDGLIRFKDTRGIAYIRNSYGTIRRLGAAAEPVV